MSQETYPHQDLEYTGLTPEEVEESRRLHGANILTPPPRDPWWKLYLEKFEDPIIRILLVAAVIAILAGIIEGQYAEGIGIIIAVFLATTLGFINEYKAGQEFDILNKVSDDESIKVIRGGSYTSIPKKDLVVGDIVALEQGEEIPADGEVLNAISFQVNEASLTGESLPVNKKPKAQLPKDNLPKDNLNEPLTKEVETIAFPYAYPPYQVLRGTFVSDGHALIRLTSVGDASEIGKTARSAAEETETITPLNRQLGRLGQVIGVCGFAVALLIFLALSIRSGVLGDLGQQVPIPTQSTVQSDSVDSIPPTLAEIQKVRESLRDTWGEQVDAFPLGQRIVEEKTEYYLKLPLKSGELYLLISLFLFLAVALTRVWIPVLFDGVELTGRKRPENSWLDKEGFFPWLQAILAGVFLFAILIVVGVLFGLLTGPPSTWLPVATVMSLLRFFMVAVTIIVVAVPEGLPMSVTLSLAYSMRKMTAANNLVRRMHACETIGAATVICSDKTGTLTMNKMKVSAFNFSSLPPEPGPLQAEVALNQLDWKLILEGVAGNSTANLGADAQGHLSIPLGNPTESALLLWLEEAGISYKARRAEFNILGQLTFSTERKYMGTLGTGVLGAQTLHVKGAPEIVLGRSQTVRLQNGEIVELTPEIRQKLQEALKNEQKRGMRTLGLAYRTLEGKSDKEFSADFIQKLVEEDNLIFLGFFSIADPVRPEVPPAVKACAIAGVKVKMVTGDNQVTAREIATEISILEKGDDNPASIVTGDEFMALSEAEALQASQDLKIMSRARPLAKQRLVNLLQKQGEVVAVTGDGSNDGPALNHADVGLAMGITGTSVAKEASDIILLDDSFASIVKAIMWGRSIYSNIQKFILFQLTINVLALGVALLGPFLGIQLPLTVTQMLWVNLIMDTFAALALASEPPDWEVMKKPPRRPEAFIVTPTMAKFIFSVGGFFLICFLFLVLCLNQVFPMNLETTLGRHNLSVFFTTFVFIQFWNLFNARTLGQTRSALSHLGESKMFLLIIFVIAIGQICMTQFGGEVFRTVPLSLREWVLIIVCTSVVLWVGELIRLARRKMAS
ncbi:MAG: calcium-translocating P-type ATPase, PMCA-type [Deltaproteobacteria bacterium]|nr:calcium-translocating P-type ATPase, PMCA-type [Deltaproteobacteria bacterium]